MNRDMIEQHVYNKLHNEPTGHDFLHAKRVVQNAMLLKDDSMDQDVIVATCLVHDLFDDKVESMYRDSRDNVLSLLEKAMLSEQQIKHIFSIVDTMSYRTGKTPTTIEGQIVQDADRLDALGAIGIARAFSYGGANNRLLYDPLSTDSTDTVSHFYQKLFHLVGLMNTKKARDMATHRTMYMRQFIEKLYNEIQQESVR